MSKVYSMGSPAGFFSLAVLSIWTGAIVAGDMPYPLSGLDYYMNQGLCGSFTSSCLTSLSWYIQLPTSNSAGFPAESDNSYLGIANPCIGPAASCQWANVDAYLLSNADTYRYHVIELNITLPTLSSGTAASYSADLASIMSYTKSLRVVCSAPRPAFAAHALGNLINMTRNVSSTGNDSYALAVPELARLVASNCGLSGELPVTVGRLLKLQLLDLSSNLLTGPLPAISTVAAPLLNLSGNLLTGGVNAQWALLAGCGGIVDMSSNMLSGTLPASLTDSSCTPTDKGPDALPCRSTTTLTPGACYVDGAVWGDVPSLTVTTGLVSVLRVLRQPFPSPPAPPLPMDSAPPSPLVPSPLVTLYSQLPPWYAQLSYAALADKIPQWWPSIYRTANYSYNSLLVPNQNSTCTARSAMPDPGLSADPLRQLFPFSVLLYNNPGLLGKKDSIVYAAAQSRDLYIHNYLENLCTAVNWWSIILSLAIVWPTCLVGAFVLGVILHFTPALGTLAPPVMIIHQTSHQQGQSQLVNESSAMEFATQAPAQAQWAVTETSGGRDAKQGLQPSPSGSNAFPVPVAEAYMTRTDADHPYSITPPNSGLTIIDRISFPVAEARIRPVGEGITPHASTNPGPHGSQASSEQHVANGGEGGENQPVDSRAAVQPTFVQRSFVAIDKGFMGTCGFLEATMVWCYRGALKPTFLWALYHVRLAVLMAWLVALYLTTCALAYALFQPSRTQYCATGSVYCWEYLYIAPLITMTVPFGLTSYVLMLAWQEGQRTLPRKDMHSDSEGKDQTAGGSWAVELNLRPKTSKDSPFHPSRNSPKVSPSPLRGTPCTSTQQTSHGLAEETVHGFTTIPEGADAVALGAAVPMQPVVLCQDSWTARRTVFSMTPAAQDNGDGDGLSVAGSGWSYSSGTLAAAVAMALQTARRAAEAAAVLRHTLFAVPHKFSTPAIYHMNRPVAKGSTELADVAVRSVTPRTLPHLGVDAAGYGLVPPADLLALPHARSGAELPDGRHCGTTHSVQTTWATAPGPLPVGERSSPGGSETDVPAEVLCAFPEARLVSYQVLLAPAVQQQSQPEHTSAIQAMQGSGSGLLALSSGGGLGSRACAGVLTLPRGGSVGGVLNRTSAGEMPNQNPVSGTHAQDTILYPHLANCRTSNCSTSLEQQSMLFGMQGVLDSGQGLLQGPSGPYQQQQVLLSQLQQEQQEQQQPKVHSASSARAVSESVVQPSITTTSITCTNTSDENTSSHPFSGVGATSKPSANTLESAPGLPYGAAGRAPTADPSAVVDLAPGRRLQTHLPKSCCTLMFIVPCTVFMFALVSTPLAMPALAAALVCFAWQGLGRAAEDCCPRQWVKGPGCKQGMCCTSGRAARDVCCTPWLYDAHLAVRLEAALYTHILFSGPIHAAPLAITITALLVKSPEWGSASLPYYSVYAPCLGVCIATIGLWVAEAVTKCRGWQRAMRRLLSI